MRLNPFSQDPSPKAPRSPRRDAAPHGRAHPARRREPPRSPSPMPEPFALELAGRRCTASPCMVALPRRPGRARARSPPTTPRPASTRLPAEEDPLRRAEGEQAWSMTLTRQRSRVRFPARRSATTTCSTPAPTPSSPCSARSPRPPEGERVVARLLLRSLGPEWAQAHQVKAYERPLPEQTATQRPPPPPSVRSAGRDGGAWTISLSPSSPWWGSARCKWLPVGAERARSWKTALLGLGAGIVGKSWRSPAGPASAGRAVAQPRLTTPLLIKEKVSRDRPSTAEMRGDRHPARVGGHEGRPQAGEGIARSSGIAAYRHYDHPAGARFTVTQGCGPSLPAAAQPAPVRRRGSSASRSVLGVREAAALWHPPGARDETPLVERTGARVLLPSTPGASGSGAPRRRHDRCGRNPRPGPLLRRPAAPPPPLRGAHAHGQVHPHAPPRRPQAAGEGRGPRRRRHRRHRPPRRPRGGHPRRRPRVADRPGEASWTWPPPSGFPGINLLDTRIFSRP